MKNRYEAQSIRRRTTMLRRGNSWDSNLGLWFPGWLARLGFRVAVVARQLVKPHLEPQYRELIRPITYRNPAIPGSGGCRWV